jgi:uncharacterized membrane protein YcaP (DUF421 family)
MDAVLRALSIYLLLLLLFRVAGRRSLAEMSAFDFVLLLIIGESTQQALLGDDFSVTNAFLVIVTLLSIDVGLSLMKQRSVLAEKLIDGVPTILVDHGRPLQEPIRKARINEDDILQSARERAGLERMDQIKYAVLEVSGGITVIPKDRG